MIRTTVVCMDVGTPLSMDACNNTGGNIGGKTCSKGGQLSMWSSPALRGRLADWKLIGPVWTDNTTVLRDGFLSHEFVTIDFLGTMPLIDTQDSSRQSSGDRAANSTSNTFYFLNNVGGNGGGDGCCSGTTAYTVLKQPDGPGTKFQKFGPGQRMIDWGSFTLKDPLPSAYKDSLDLLVGTQSRGLSMARTLGSEESDQVTKPGRRVLIGWTGPAPSETFNASSSVGSSQSLPRDLFVDPSTSKLVQKFVPELQMLRTSTEPIANIEGGNNLVSKNVPMGIDAIEVVSTFPRACVAGHCGIEVLASRNTFGSGEALRISFNSKLGLIIVNGTTMRNSFVRAAPLPLPLSSSIAFELHAIVDHSIVELIVNGDIAFVIYVAPYSENTLGNVRSFGNRGVVSNIWKLKEANINS